MNTHTREKRPYRFGNLKEMFIEQGVELAHGRGVEKSSLRKVTKQIGVSTAACCNHFGDIDELPQGTYSHVIDRFATALKQAVEDNPCHDVTISTGVVYVEFSVKCPHYFSFLFDSEYLGIQTKEAEVTWDSSFTPFEISVDGTGRGMRELNIDEKELGDDPLVMWAAIHGLAAMVSMKGVQYDDGDWGVLTEKILFDKVILQHELKTRRNSL